MHTPDSRYDTPMAMDTDTPTHINTNADTHAKTHTQKNANTLAEVTQKLDAFTDL